MGPHQRQEQYLTGQLEVELTPQVRRGVQCAALEVSAAALYYGVDVGVQCIYTVHYCTLYVGMCYI